MEASSAARRVLVAALHEPRIILSQLRSLRITPTAFGHPTMRRSITAAFQLLDRGEHVCPESIVAAAGLADDKARQLERLDAEKSPTDLTAELAVLAQEQQRQELNELGQAALNGQGIRCNEHIEEIADRLRRIQEVGTRRVSSGGTMAELAERSYQAQIEGRDDVIPTGIDALDSALVGGVGAGDLLVIGAHTSHGKSLLAGDICYRMAERGVPAIVFSFEDSPMKTFYRFIRRHVTIPMEDLLRNRVGHAHPQHGEYTRASSIVSKLPLRYEAAHGQTMGEVENTLWRAVDSEGVRVFVVDYLQNASPDRGAGKTIAVEEVVNSCRNLAARYNCACIATSQVNRLAPPRPTLNHLKWAGAIEEGATDVVMLAREGSGEKSIMTVSVEKSKNGPLYMDRDALQLMVNWPKFTVEG